MAGYRKNLFIKIKRAIQTYLIVMKYYSLY